MNELNSQNPPPEIVTLVVTVEEIRITLGPSEEHWRKAAFMSWKELPESFEAAFGDEDITTANAIPLRAMVREVAKQRLHLHQFEEPYTDYMVGETGIGKMVRRTVTVAIGYQGDGPLPLSTGSTTIERGVNRKPASTEVPAPMAMPTLFHSLWNFIKRPA